MNNVLTISTFRFKVSLLKHHKLNKCSILSRHGWKLSSIIFLQLIFICTPKHLIEVSGHFMPKFLCLKLEQVPIPMASLLSLLTLRPEHFVKNVQDLK